MNETSSHFKQATLAVAEKLEKCPGLSRTRTHDPLTILTQSYYTGAPFSLKVLCNVSNKRITSGIVYFRNLRYNFQSKSVRLLRTQTRTAKTLLIPPSDAIFLSRKPYLFTGSCPNNLRYNIGHAFSTKDNDVSSKNCSVFHRGAWWYSSNPNDCTQTNLNGLYTALHGQPKTGIYWYKTGQMIERLKATQILLQPVV